jgi:hypothetical protein
MHLTKARRFPPLGCPAIHRRNDCEAHQFRVGYSPEGAIRVPDKFAEFLEKEIAIPGATRKSVWKALDHKAAIWDRQRQAASGDARRELIGFLGQAGRILHFFHHGYSGGIPTACDTRLVQLIEQLPPE